MRWIATPPGAEEIYEGNLVEALIDDGLWAPLISSIRAARETLDLSQLLFEPDFAPGEWPLADEFADAAARGVRVRLLVNKNAVIPDSYRELVAHFGGTPVDVARLALGQSVLHAKLAIVDSATAFLVDAPYEQKYADTSGHTFEGERRTKNKPFHSVSLRLEGPAVDRVQTMFERLWARAHDAPPEPLAPPRVEAPRAGPQTLQLLWTSPAGLLSPREDAGILNAYLRAIESAERFVYMETQYFTSSTLSDALSRALELRPSLEVILVLNPYMDIPGYEAWQKRRLSEMRAFEHPRIGVFSLWTPRRVTKHAAIRTIYVHSKVGIVDDCWGTVGSANLDSISLEDADEFVVPVARNVEINAALLDGVDGAPATGAVAALRRRLWAEHLGDEAAWVAQPPPEGWLVRWRAVADENLRRFEAGRHDLLGRAFPHGEMTRRATGIRRRS